VDHAPFQVVETLNLEHDPANILARDGVLGSDIPERVACFVILLTSWLATAGTLRLRRAVLP